MMMGFNRDQSPPPRLSDDTVAAIRTVLARYVNDGEQGSDLHDALRDAAAEARQKGIMAERLLVTLKESWNALPEVRDADGTTARAQSTRLQKLITRCIEEYYGD